jgi:hypothetical protein
MVSIFKQYCFVFLVCTWGCWSQSVNYFMNLASIVNMANSGTHVGFIVWYNYSVIFHMLPMCTLHIWALEDSHVCLHFDQGYINGDFQSDYRGWKLITKQFLGQTHVDMDRHIHVWLTDIKSIYTDILNTFRDYACKSYSVVVLDGDSADIILSVLMLLKELQVCEVQLFIVFKFVRIWY